MGQSTNNNFADINLKAREIRQTPQCLKRISQYIQQAAHTFLLTVCNNISMKNVTSRVKHVKLLNQLNVLKD